ncbi:MAG: glycoside hydrolase family 2 protein [Firmicutes bacterium]|nr:glycoside hydrolase family 2 protein [Bacillota bacterium]
MITQDLAGSWTLEEDSQALRIEGIVPGSVMLDLLRAGRMEDPFYRDRERYLAQTVSRLDYRYTRAFEVDQALLSCDEIVLVCEGLDTLADIAINDQWIASTDNMHRRYEFDVRRALVRGDNTISVTLRSPLPLMAEAENRDPLWGVPDAIAGFTHIRKGHSMFGWDWGPQIPDAGIWRPIYLQGIGGGCLADVKTSQRHANGDVLLDVTVGVQSFRGVQRGRVAIAVTAPDGQVYTAEGDADSCARLCVLINQPELWWPVGYGEQPLYQVTVTLLSETAVLDEKRLRVGLRTVSLRREPDAWGESFEFVVNGVPIFIRGANYIPEDVLLSRCHRERTLRLLDDAVEANFNSLRVWGGGVYPEDYFFDLCDERGLLVWQDFMFACGVYRLTAPFEETVRQEAIDNVRRLRHHACLCLWCGNNEMETGWAHWEFAKPDDLRADYLRLFEEILPGIVAEHDPQTPYWPSSPSSGGQFVSPNDETRGDVHYWDVWHAQKPFTEYRKFHFRFCSEFGFQSFPSDKTVRRFTVAQDRNIFSYVMERHQKNGEANGKILYYLSQNFKYPRDFSSVLYASQVLQAEAIRYGVEHWRRHRGRCMGSIYWQFNDCWPVASWSSIDSEGRWKALHYFAKRFYAPILISAAEEGTAAVLCVTNDTRESVTGEVRWSLRDAGSHELASGVSRLDLNALSVQYLAPMDFSGHIETDEALRRTYLEYAFAVDGSLLSSGTVLFCPAKHFEFEDPKLSVTIRDSGESFDLTVEAQAFARYVELELKEVDGHFDDNYFDLSAGHEKRVRVLKSSLSRVMSADELAQELKVRSICELDEAAARSGALIEVDRLKVSATVPSL